MDEYDRHVPIGTFGSVPFGVTSAKEMKLVLQASDGWLINQNLP